MTIFQVLYVFFTVFFGSLIAVNAYRDRERWANLWDTIPNDSRVRLVAILAIPPVTWGVCGWLLW